MIVMSALVIAGCVFGAFGLIMVPMILKQAPGVPPTFAAVMVVVGVIMLVIPLAIAIWWLVLFTRRRVALEFSTRGAAPPETFPTADSHVALATTFSPQVSAAPAAPAIPLSILIITVFFLISCGSVLMGLPFTIRMNVPGILMGMVVRGWVSWTYIVVLVLGQAALSIAVLRKRAWALDGLIAFAAFSAVNAVLFAISPSRKAVFDSMFAGMFSKLPTPPGMNLSDFTDTVEKIIPISMAGGFLISVVILYFLVTRRRAFRVACASRTESAQ